MKKYAITLEIITKDCLKIINVKDLLQDLTWCGGCRSPEDPAFESFEKVEIKYIKELK